MTQLINQKPKQLFLPMPTTKNFWLKKFLGRPIVRAGILILITFFGSIVVTVLFYHFPQSIIGIENSPKLTQKLTALVKKTDSTKQFPNISITAKAGVVYDLTDGKILYDKNANQILPLASITKLMTVLIASQKLNQTDLVELSNNNNRETWQLKELIDYTLVNSYNEGASALATAVTNKTGQNFVQLMNNEKDRLGFQTLSFNNETGLDVSDNQAGAYGGALDVAKLHAYIIKNYPNVLEATKEPVINVYNTNLDRYLAVNTNPSTNQFPGLISSKTGTTPLAGANLSLILDVGLNHPIAIVILGSTENDRFSDAKKLTEATINYLSEPQK